MQNLARLALSVRHLDGDVAELGVYRGGSARVIRAATGKVVRLFDTFTGIPTDDEISGGHRAGEFAAGLIDVRNYLGDEGYEYRPGTFPNTAPPDDQKYSFVHLDADIYQAVRAGLEYFIPRMVEGGVIVLDDYGWVNCPGVVRAVVEAGIGVSVAVGQAWHVAGSPSPPVVIEQGANGIGDALLGLTVVAQLAKDNPAVAVHYRVSQKALPWVELFTGYDALATTGKTHTEDAGYGILQMNAGYYTDLYAGCPTPRRERYAKNVGASGSRLPALRDSAAVRRAGEATTGCVVLAPFCEDPSRQWPLTEWLMLESLLYGAGFSTIVLHDRPSADIAAFIHSNLFLGESPTKVVGVISSAAAIVSNDSGMAHVGGVLGTATVVVGPTRTPGDVYGGYPSVKCLGGEPPSSVGAEVLRTLDGRPDRSRIVAKQADDSGTR